MSFTINYFPPLKPSYPALFALYVDQTFIYTFTEFQTALDHINKHFNNPSPLHITIIPQQ